MFGIEIHTVPGGYQVWRTGRFKQLANFNIYSSKMWAWTENAYWKVVRLK